MACTPQEVRRKKIAEAIEYLKAKSNANTVRFDSDRGVAIITPSSDSKTVRTQANAIDYGRRMANDVMKNPDLGLPYSNFGSWASVNPIAGTNNVELSFSFPQGLMQSLQKQYDEAGMSEAYSEFLLEERIMMKELMLDGQLEYDEEYFDDLPKQNLEKLDFSVLIDYKKLMKARVDSLVQTLTAQYSHSKDVDTRQKLNEMRKIQSKIEGDLGSLMSPATIFEDTLQFIERDLSTIDTLLGNSNITNLQTAEKMISFYQTISDYTLANKGNNPFIDIAAAYDEKGDLLLDQDITEVLDELSKKIQQKKNNLDAAKQSYLKAIVDKAPYIQNMFPGLDSDSMLDEIPDIGIVSKTFLSIDKTFAGNDSLLSQLIRVEFELSRGRNKGYVGELIGKLNAIVPRVQKKLPKVSGILGTGLLSENDWNGFYQKDSSGLKTGRIIDKFSNTWFRSYRDAMDSFNNARISATKLKDWNKVNKSFTDKYKWINNNANFFDVTRLPEVIENPEFSDFKEYFNTEEAESYKAKVISEIGQFYYDRLLVRQLESLREFKNWRTETVQAALIDHGATSISSLPHAIKYNLNISIVRNSPFELMESHNNNGTSEIEVGSFQYPSMVKNIEFYPKETISKFVKSSNRVQEVSSGYYDENFKNIEQDKDLSDFWEILEESTHYMNMTLADAESMIKHGSLPSMKKSFAEILIDPHSGMSGKAILIRDNLKRWLSSQFTVNTENDKNADDFDKINKAQFKSNEIEINQRVQLETLKINRIAGIDISKIKIKNGIPESVQKELRRISGQNDVSNITDIPGFIKSHITDQVLNEQTLNLPVLLRAYLEMTAEYKAQKESLPQLSIIQEFYNGIKRDTTNSSKKGATQLENVIIKAYNALTNQKSLSQERINAQQRMNYWFNKNILGNTDTAMWLNMGKRDFWLVSSFDKIEKELRKEMKLQLENPALSEEEKKEIMQDIARLGNNFALSAIYEALVNKFQVFQGLAYNIKSNIVNRFQGWFQGMAYDNGQLWTEGNFQTSTGFTSRRVSRFLPGMKEYARQIDITKLLIDQMGILQDATNEIDRARNTSGVVGAAKKLSPFYITEYTEWNNQAPQILAILMDKEIIDNEGNPHKIFDGRTFSAYDIKNGKLVLKPEFDNPENKSEWLEFDNDNATNTKNFISSVISLINGDYSKTGSIYAKKTSMGKTLMMFKTWLPNAIYNRFAGLFDIDGQTNLMLQKENFKGIYASQRASTGAITGAITGTLAAGLPGALIGGALGAVGGAWVNKKQRGSLGLDMSIAKDAAAVGQAVLKKMIGMPVNFVSGREIVKNHQLGNMATTPEDLQRLKSITAELAVLMTMILFKIAVKGLLGPNDEDEPKTYMLDGEKQQNPYYPGKLQSDREKQMHNVLENEVTRIINDLTLYTNPSAMFDNISRVALVGIFEDIKKVSEAYVKYSQGLDKIQTGPNAGESRLWNTTLSATAPGLFQGPLTLGFEKSMETEYEKGEYLDDLFYSDYKKDKKVMKSDKTATKSQLVNEMQNEYDYANQSPETRLELDDIIDKEVKEILKNNNSFQINRLMYDEDQMLIE